MTRARGERPPSINISKGPQSFCDATGCLVNANQELSEGLRFISSPGSECLKIPTFEPQAVIQVSLGGSHHGGSAEVIV